MKRNVLFQDGGKCLKVQWWKELLILVGDSSHMLQGLGLI